LPQTLASTVLWDEQEVCTDTHTHTHTKTKQNKTKKKNIKLVYQRLHKFEVEQLVTTITISYH